MTLQNTFYPLPTRDNYFDFLARCYFGSDDNFLRCCVRRAYLDLNRTLHGFAAVKDSKDLRENGHDCIIQLLEELPSNKIASQDMFDNWHERACSQLKILYREGGFDKLFVGQAQKWLNMALKYIFTFGDERLPGYASLYQFAHVPIDNVFLERIAQLGGPGIHSPWSRLEPYQAYLEFQRKCRKLFAGSAPLDAEFWLWQNGVTSRNEPAESSDNAQR